MVLRTVGVTLLPLLRSRTETRTVAPSLAVNERKTAAVRAVLQGYAVMLPVAHDFVPGGGGNGGGGLPSAVSHGNGGGGFPSATYHGNGGGGFPSATAL